MQTISFCLTLLAGLDMYMFLPVVINQLEPGWI